MNPSRVDFAPRVDAWLHTWCISGIDYANRNVAHGETRSQILEAACRVQQLAQQGRVARLEYLAGGVFLGKIDMGADVTRIANKIETSGLPSPIKSRLVNIAGCKVRQAQAGITASLELAMEVARARVLRGAPCGRTAIEHGIACTEEEASAYPGRGFRFYRAQNWIQMHAARGPAGRRVERGESCSIVAAEHEIVLPEALRELESRAILSVGQQMVDRGDTLEQIVDALGIQCSASHALLLYMIDTRAIRIGLNGAAGETGPDAGQG
ncbi:hypothetical protein BamIOP4010DRAFT_3626 [Burkholderia ambifaria IOP40-10]|uniref:Uncharacterized protein n=1 Tax=Burkholderia ambifaria IOP40-10 TaxID=396596 RepID=B1FHW6_9BURK|nr:hypothetical protein [Burkholderia ambifaria]EDT02837.1 hypothetical protein BamIOP4010DRAFT_3626 [Burkholderia ambifaria IOP40-10]